MIKICHPREGEEPGSR